MARPRERPVTVRISATDWCEGGLDLDDAVEIARAFAEHGAAGIDVSTGQVVSDEQPDFGRSYQTPYADRIRNEIGRSGGVAVIAVGAISSYDDVNSIILAGRADLCALGRTHLYDPQWTLHAAAEQGYAGPGATWPTPFAAGRRSTACWAHGGPAAAARADPGRGLRGPRMPAGGRLPGNAFALGERAFGAALPMSSALPDRRKGVQHHSRRPGLYRHALGIISYVLQSRLRRINQTAV